jgi:hypothetical protein
MPLLVWNGTSMDIIGNSAVIFRKKIGQNPRRRSVGRKRGKFEEKEAGASPCKRSPAVGHSFSYLKSDKNDCGEELACAN